MTTLSGLYVWETKNSFSTMEIIWSGYVASTAGLLYADSTNVYVTGQHAGNDSELRQITRIDLVNSYAEYDVSPAGIYPGMRMVHYIDDFRYALYSVAHDFPPSGSPVSGYLYYQTYPEIAGAWSQADSEPSSVDLIFPDNLDSPRFLLGLAGNTVGKVRVILAASGLAIRYNTDYSAMTSGAAVTDLEAVRIL